MEGLWHVFYYRDGFCIPWYFYFIYFILIKLGIYSSINAILHICYIFMIYLMLIIYFVIILNLFF